MGLCKSCIKPDTYSLELHFLKHESRLIPRVPREFQDTLICPGISYFRHFPPLSDAACMSGADQDNYESDSSAWPLRRTETVSSCTKRFPIACPLIRDQNPCVCRESCGVLRRHASYSMWMGVRLESGVRECKLCWTDGTFVLWWDNSGVQLTMWNTYRGHVPTQSLEQTIVLQVLRNTVVPLWHMNTPNHSLNWGGTTTRLRTGFLGRHRHTSQIVVKW
jgi:hypothetical protein